MNELFFEQEIAEVDGWPARCCFTWDVDIVVEAEWEKNEIGVCEVTKTKRIVRTELLTGHEAMAWRRAQQVTA